MSAGQYDERIRRGMALLDEKMPGWEHRIDLIVLDLADCGLCVVGQLFWHPQTGDDRDDDIAYVDGLEALSLNLDTDIEVDYGFTLRSRRECFRDLTYAWARHIRARLTGGTP